MRCHRNKMHHNFEQNYITLGPPDYMCSNISPSILCVQSYSRLDVIIHWWWSWSRLWPLLPFRWNWGSCRCDWFGGDGLAVFGFFPVSSWLFFSLICRMVRSLNAELYFALNFRKWHENMFGIENLGNIIRVAEKRLHKIFLLGIYGVNWVLSNEYFLVIMLSIPLILEDFLLHIRINNVNSYFLGLKRLLDHYEKLDKRVDWLV